MRTRGNDVIIVLTAGHSNTDPGAVANGATEAGLMTEMRNIVAKKLREAGHTVHTDGEGTVNQSLNDAIALIKRHQPAVALELHMNAAASPLATGVETIALPKDKRLAQSLSAAVAGVLGMRVRGENGWIDQSQSARGRLGYINAGGLILETAFITNLADLQATRDKLWLVASAIAQTIGGNRAAA